MRGVESLRWIEDGHVAVAEDGELNAGIIGNLWAVCKGDEIIAQGEAVDFEQAKCAVEKIFGSWQVT